MSRRTALVCIDLQNDFATRGGRYQIPGPSIDLMVNIMFPFLMEYGISIAEIVSDYRQPRPGDDRDCCRPGEWGYESLVPPALRKGRQWVKSMNSPVWTRKGIGDPSVVPGSPFPDPAGFERWLDEHVGKRDEVVVVLFGLTADCCVLSTVQELRWRGYDVHVLSEATDVRSADQDEKRRFLSTAPFIFWGRTVGWEELKGSFERRS
ncbi:MAG: cysteine hydrolase family protein [Candidatus Thermoplasmatota archaeon]|nr:cysteine hydrolase family protein [Candidatus Thermoplasmatota archaeon]